MADGTVKDGGYSSSGGSSASALKLDPDEHIVKIEAVQGDRLNGLRVFTSKGRESHWFGRLFDGRGGRIVELFSASAENPIIDFERDVRGAWGVTCPKIVKVQRLNDPPPARPPLPAKPSEVSCRASHAPRLPLDAAPSLRRIQTSHIMRALITYNKDALYCT
jgi:hypothetical protein